MYEPNKQSQTQVPETREELLAALKQIDSWESDQKDLWFWEKLGRLPFLILDKCTPKFLHKKIGEAFNEMGNYIQTGGQYLISEQATLKHIHSSLKGTTYERESLELADLKYLPLAVMDRSAEEMIEQGARFATVQGAATGVGGLFTLAPDIPAMLGMSLKSIQEVAICYGYDPNDKQERVFAMKCLQFASSDIVGKKAVLDELASFTGNAPQTQMVSQLQGWREVFEAYRDNFGWKKLFQLVPVVGMVFGAFVNRGALRDVGEAAKMLYRKRRVTARLKSMETSLSSIDDDGRQAE